MVSVRRTARLRALWAALGAAKRSGGPGVRQRLAAVPRMLRLGLSGRYPFLDRTRIGLAVLALAYVISPIDLMPEGFMLLLGLGDDAVVAAWLVGALLAEAGTFLDWERNGFPTVAGEVIS